MRRRGFSLVELLVVIFIIAMLIAILLPALSQVVEEANRDRCRASLHNIAITLRAYADSDPNKNWPGILSSIPSAQTWNRIGYHSTTLANDTNNPTYVQGNSRILFTCLIKTGMCTPDQFVCPSVKTDKATTTKDPATGNVLYDFPTDFTSGRNNMTISYSYQNIWVTHISPTTNEGMPIMADRNPQYMFTADAANGGVVASVRPNLGGGPTAIQKSWLTDASRTERRSANSPNHQGQGQNVLYAGGYVKWQVTPLCGRTINGTTLDNIYTQSLANDTIGWGQDPTTAGFTAGTGPGDDTWLGP